MGSGDGDGSRGTRRGGSGDAATGSAARLELVRRLRPRARWEQAPSHSLGVDHVVKLLKARP